jgi:hypothetical protein
MMTLLSSATVLAMTICVAGCSTTAEPRGSSHGGASHGESSESGHGLTTQRATPRDPVATGSDIRGRSLVAEPKRPEMALVSPGVLRGELTLRYDSGATNKLWLYLPDTGGRPMLDRSLPLVLFAPSGTQGLNGAAPSEVDEAEHLPWVRAGFAVAAFESDGALPITKDGAAPSAQDYLKSIHAFRETAGGLMNAVEALDAASKVLREADPDRVVLVGSGSGGTVALNVARAWHKLQWARAVVVFSPILDVAGATDKLMLDALDSAQPGVAKFARESSPGLVPEQLKTPAFLFTSREPAVSVTGEATSDAASLERYADQLRAAGQSPQLVVMPTGDPYTAMVRDGIDLAIEWTQRELAKRK